MDLSSHQKRIISGLSLAAILAACLFIGGWPLRIMLCLAAMIGLWEFGQMFWPGFANLPDKIALYVSGLLVCLFGSLSSLDSPYALGSLDLSAVNASHAAQATNALWPIAVLGLLALYAALRFLFRYGSGNDEAKLANHAIILFGVLYLPFSLQLALHISLQEQFLIILAAVGSDTGAYYAGSYLGKHKIWPRVSPKKSWEGALGGLCAAMLILAVYGSLVQIPLLSHLTFWQWGLIGLTLSIAAQIGDFFESALKRSVGVKDSSNLIPGHGGVLDRLDSIVFVLPVYMFLRLICLHGV